MRDYLKYLEQKYEDVIVAIVRQKPRIPIGQLINFVLEELKNIDKSKTEVRDTILCMTGQGKLRIEAISKKRLEVSLREEDK